MEIFTIGHSNYTIDRFLDMLKKYNINCVVDSRAVPYSKYNVQFDKERLKYTLKENGIFYIYMGKEFAAKRRDKESYNKEGYADFEKVIKEKTFIEGVKRLKDGCNKGFRIALLGAMEDPIRCQRGILLGRALVREGFKVSHILNDYKLENQEDIEERILNKYFKNRDQISIYDILENKSEREMIDKGYKLANKEIGYRIEGIKNKS